MITPEEMEQLGVICEWIGKNCADGIQLARAKFGDGDAMLFMSLNEIPADHAPHHFILEGVSAQEQFQRDLRAVAEGRIDIEPMQNFWNDVFLMFGEGATPLAIIVRGEATYLGALSPASGEGPATIPKETLQ